MRIGCTAHTLVLVVMDQCRRRIVGFGVHRGVVDGVALRHMFNRAKGRQPAPTYVSSDHDPLYRFHQWQANLRILDVEAIKTVPVRAAVSSIRRTPDRHDSKRMSRPDAVLDGR